jgi:LysM repeat protein
MARVKRKENKMIPNRLPVLRHILAILVVLSMLLGAFPRPALAANCRTYYTVKEGDTKTSIAKHFKLDWSDIAGANNMKTGAKIKVGDRLCIPYTEDEEEELPNPKVRLRVSASHTLLFLTVSGLSDKKGIFIVRVRDATVGVGGFYKLGRIKVKKNSTTKENFAVPKDLIRTLYLQVCIKNSSTNELSCRTMIHP